MSTKWSDVEVRLALIRRPERPSRLAMDPEKLGELADDMAANGLLQRIGLRGPSADGTYEIVWGDRRTSAAQLLQWETIPARACPADTDPLVARAAENFQRDELTPVEEALLIKEMMDGGRPLVEIARLLRRSAPWAAGRLALLALPDDLRDAVHERRLALSVANALAEIDHDELRREYIAEAERVGANGATVGLWAAHYKADRSRIITNHLTVQSIIEARSGYVIYYKCDACQESVDYRDTGELRFCKGCRDSLLAELAAAHRAAAAPAG